MGERQCRYTCHTAYLHCFPLDMSGMVGMAQMLAVYHYGHYTLKAGQIQSHESAIVPSDAAAVLEWNLGVPLPRWTSPPSHRHDCHH